MIFQVTRTSNNWSEEKPFDTCIPIKLTNVQTRTFHTPEEFDNKFGDREGKWLDRGTNHRVDARGYITRDMGLEDVWGIEINSLKELIDFPINIISYVFNLDSKALYKIKLNYINYLLGMYVINQNNIELNTYGIYKSKTSSIVSMLPAYNYSKNLEKSNIGIK